MQHMAKAVLGIKIKSRNVLLSSLSKKANTQQASEFPHVHFERVKSDVTDLDYITMWESI